LGGGWLAGLPQPQISVAPAARPSGDSRKPAGESGAASGSVCDRSEITSHASPSRPVPSLRRRLLAHKLPGREPNHDTNQDYDAQNEQSPIRPGAAEFDTQSPKAERIGDRSDKKTDSEKWPVHGGLHLRAGGRQKESPGKGMACQGSAPSVPWKRYGRISRSTCAS
jgi:hypothetical protein